MNEMDLVGRLRELDRPADPPDLFRDQLLGLLTAELDDITALGERPASSLDEAREAFDPVRPSLPGSRRRVRGLAVAAAAFAIVVVGGLVTWWLVPGDPGDVAETPPIVTTDPAPEVSTPDPTGPEGAVVSDTSVQLPSGRFPSAVASDGQRFWIIAGSEVLEPGAPPASEATLLAVDPRTGDISAEVGLSGSPLIVAADDDAVWVAHWETGAVTRVDPTTGQVVASVQLELPFDFGGGPNRRLFIPNFMAVGHGSVWVSTARGAVARIDVATNAVVDSIELTPPHPSQLAIGPTGVWVAENVYGLTHIEAESGAVSTILLEDLDHSARLVAVVEGDVYVAGNRLGRNPDGSFQIRAGGYISGDQDAVSRVDPDTLEVLGSTVFDEPIVFLGWVNGFFGALDGRGTLWRIDALPELVSNTSSTNWVDNPIVQLGREAWMVDGWGSQLIRLRETGPAPAALPFEIEEQSEPRAVPADLALSPDWIPLDRGPLGSRWPAVVAWTGQEIVLWGGEPVGGGPGLGGGAAYRPQTETWRQLSESPLAPASEAGWVWTAEELIIWTRSATAAAWQPATDSWRTIANWPLRGSFYRRAVWTGQDILDADQGLLVDPDTGASRPIAEPPRLDRRASVVWADGYLVAVTGDGTYNLGADAWVEMPASGLTPLATAGTWTGTEVVAVDYLMGAAGYDPQTNTWSSYPAVPLRFFECFPRGNTLLGRAVAEHCSGVGIWDPERLAWIPLAFPQPHESTRLISTGEELYAWGDGFYRLDRDSVTRPRRLAVGTSLLDLPQGWRLVSSTGGTAIEIDLEATGGDTCTVNAIHANARTVLRSYLTKQTEAVLLTPVVGGRPVNALEVSAGELDSAHHLVWATGTTDVIDVACDNPEATQLIAQHTWAPYQ